jgi:hypothetical protein
MSAKRLLQIVVIAATSLVVPVGIGLAAASTEAAWRKSVCHWFHSEVCQGLFFYHYTEVQS